MEPLRILVVDDEPGMRLGALRVLERYTVRLPEVEGEVHFELDVADSGEAALQKIAERPPDLLLLDHKLPGISGLEVLEKLSAEGREVLTVMITAYATLDTAVSATKRGAFDFLAKPFTPDELRATVFKASSHVALQRQARRHAEEKRRIRFEFVSVLAHELKAPLAAVEGYLLAIKDKALGEELESYEPMIARSVVRLEGMRKLVTDLLDMTRIESGQRRRELERLDVCEAARASLENVRATATARKIVLTGPEGAAVPLMADRIELDLVLNNLITNAVKYNRDGGQVTVAVGATGGVVTVEVADTGFGMTAGEAAKLFGDFVRLKNAYTQGIPGSGIGLSTVRKVARLYGGDATVQSEPEKGSRFTVTLKQGAV